MRTLKYFDFGIFIVRTRIIAQTQLKQTILMLSSIHKNTVIYQLQLVS